MDYLINVANEEAGAMCESHAASKNYNNVVYMVMQMYKTCYLPMAFLLCLPPGAVITQVKSLVQKQLHGRPGNARSGSRIAFHRHTAVMHRYILNPGHSTSCELLHRHRQLPGRFLPSLCVDLPIIYLWCEEQIQILSPDQQGKLIKNQPQVPQAPYRGKFAESMPVGGAVLEQEWVISTLHLWSWSTSATT